MNKHTLTFGICSLLAGNCLSDAAPMDPIAEGKQQRFFETDPYCHHLLVIDENGNALVPRVSRPEDGDGKNYTAKTERMIGEETRGAKFTKMNAKSMEKLFREKENPADDPVHNLIRGRRQLYLYLDAMFRDIAHEHPDEVVIQVHGGLNKLEGAIAKTALIVDDLAANPCLEKRKIYYIGLCWNSDLFPTYKDHLLSIREGLHQPGKAIITAPAMLLSDIGGAAARLPLNLIDFLYQDAYTVKPSAFKRTQLAETRYEQIEARTTEAGAPSGVTLQAARDLRTRAQRDVNLAKWLATQPTKVATTAFLDWFGSEPWRNMLRRTRTMFERESEYIPSLTYDEAKLMAYAKSTATGESIDAGKLLDQMNATGRLGAASLFCEEAQARLATAPTHPRVTLIGHSMGAIVACEMLQRYHRLPLNNVVFMGAACSVRDFKTHVIPYLQEQNLRASLFQEFTQTYAKDARLDLTQAKPEPKTHFYNLCLHDDVENGEPNPGELDVVQRGSLLNWIDILYQHPESENDRTLGRWVNAVLSTDNLPADVADRITMKEFGVERPLAEHRDLAKYAYKTKKPERYVQEPIQHGDFARFAFGPKKEATNLAFWRELYRESETPKTHQGLLAKAKTSRKATRGIAAIPQRTPAAAISSKSREAATGF